MAAPTDLETAVAALAVDHGALPAARARRIIETARSGGRPLISQLLAEVPEAKILEAVAAELNVAFYDLHSPTGHLTVNDEVVGRCDTGVLERGNALPLVDSDGSVVVAMANPTDLDTVSYLRSRYPEGMRIVLTPSAQIQSRLVYLSANDADRGLAETTAAPVETAAPTVATATRSPVIDYVDNLLNRAVAEGGSDLHLSFNSDKTLLLRMRVDGILRPLPPPPRGREMAVIGTIVAKAETMDSSNYREPQDGTFTFTAGGREIDTRVAMLPQMYGPTVVIRLLDSLNMSRRLDDMGFTPEHLAMMRSAMSSSAGTVLVAGPTGSGKTTTLYGMLREIDALTRAVFTVEDPVEYKLPYICQTQIRSDLGDRSLTFAKALRAILRLDPDVILVGETRDLDTARTTMNAALTGHLCLSTIHAPSSLRTYTRLIEMGVPAYMVVESVSLAISQRLVRRVHSCAVQAEPDAEERAALERWGVAVETVARPTGCAGCANSGFQGRLAVAEMLRPSAELRAKLLAQAPLSELTAQARADGFVSLFDDVVRHLRAGRTTVAEIARAVEVDGGE